MTGRQASLALGASSPRIVQDWHGRPWEPVRRVRQSVRDARAVLNGNRVGGFRMLAPLPGTPISVAAFGPTMMRVAAAEADEVVLNLVSTGHVTRVHDELSELARVPPPLAVWLPTALDPGPATLRQLRDQLAVYLAPPGYGEMFTALGHGDLVARARAGTPRSELAQDIPVALLEAVGALGSATDICRRVDEYFQAGASHVGLVPATADDPAARTLLTTLAPLVQGRSR